jgi:hypothetical protein
MKGLLIKKILCPAGDMKMGESKMLLILRPSGALAIAPEGRNIGNTHSKQKLIAQAGRNIFL